MRNQKIPLCFFLMFEINFHCINMWCGVCQFTWMMMMVMIKKKNFHLFTLVQSGSLFLIFFFVTCLSLARHHIFFRKENFLISLLAIFFSHSLSFFQRISPGQLYPPCTWERYFQQKKKNFG